VDVLLHSVSMYFGTSDVPILVACTNRAKPQLETIFTLLWQATPFPFVNPVKSAHCLLLWVCRRRWGRWLRGRRHSSRVNGACESWVGHINGVEAERDVFLGSRSPR